ncbi:hypothetical protein CTM76_08455 [Photobacterium phosphoreum]|jgi:uncharacterized protein YuzE|uniref:hypothetical protein n=1 Tax=Photobacterium phosphoreum TaxID=659 RepID=UPI0007F8C1D8|nr:hypothetical protein [Photobacterium phosphoreum]OBU39636.1 hypothetical protein AYY25_02165 [Photobacterium phosphoreum]PSU78182.1 hypothetical protein CTM76_08455 [Photobacterium phosphoreum]
MINKLVKAIRASCNFSIDGEVELFRKTAIELTNLLPAIFIDETHGGNVCNVEFNSIKNTIETCEISDLLIVVVDNKRKCARATFWQAKQEKRSKWVSQYAGNTDGSFDFKAQFNQWELLSYRPEVRPTPNFSPPKDILASPFSPSIGSFGVFYEKNNLLELNYSVAEMVSSTSFNPSSSRFTINEKLSQYSAWENEVLVRKDLESFLTALINFQIGSLIIPQHSSHQWLISYVQTQMSSLKNIRYSNSAFNPNLTLFKDVPRVDINDSNGGLSILVVDVTELES